MALTTVQAYQRELENIIAIEIERLMELISNGHLQSYEEYKGLTGRLAGLRSAIELIAEADRIYSEKYR